MKYTAGCWHLLSLDLQEGRQLRPNILAFANVLPRAMHHCHGLGLLAHGMSLLILYKPNASLGHFSAIQQLLQLPLICCISHSDGLICRVPVGGKIDIQLNACTVAVDSLSS